MQIGLALRLARCLDAQSPGRPQPAEAVEGKARRRRPRKHDVRWHILNPGRGIC